MTKDLFEHQAASRIALEQSENEVAKARAKVEQTEEVLHVLGLDGHPEGETARLESRVPVRTPIDGTVTNASSPTASMLDRTTRRS
jgi:multidrug resistance efflux pump